MSSSKEQLEIARALSEAFDPLIDMCLQLGITSPELERLLRAQFVDRAFTKLPPHPRSGRAPTDNNVMQATGVHRNYIAEIRKSGTAGATATVEGKQKLYSRGARVLSGWSTDPRFQTSSGAPMDLPLERNRERKSFQDLVEKYAGGTFPGTVLKELRRRRCVEVLDGDIVRYKSATPRTVGVTKSNIAQASKRMKRLGDTLFQGIVNPGRPRLYSEIKPMRLAAQDLALIQAVLERRAKAFLDGVEGELEARSAETPINDTKLLGVGVYSFEDDA